MANGTQVRNGKAFEYALAKAYYDYVTNAGVRAELVENEPLKQNKAAYEACDESEQNRFVLTSRATIDSMIKLEPGIMAQRGAADKLLIYMQSDQQGVEGDVRDIVLKRMNPTWEIGFSAKNNHEAVKHSRLSSTNDFGDKWLGVPCSDTYWHEIKPVFQYIREHRELGHTWKDLGKDKVSKVYVPLLNAFKKELLFINENNDNIPEKLIRYLIGEYSFYKIIKDDAHNLVVVKAFNLKGELNKTVSGVKARYKTPRLALPTRIVEFEYKEKSGSQDTLDMIMDGGWEISFRIHSADNPMPESLKFDIQLLGNPPILFTQHLFQ